MGKYMKKTQEQVEKELSSKWSNLCLVSEYTGANNKCDIMCKKCGHIWRTSVRSVINSKHGCPNCGVKEMWQEKSKAHLTDKLSKQFQIISVDSSKLATVKCKICNHIRTTTINNLLKFGCKSCKSTSQANKTRKTTKEFIHQARKIHGYKYDYSKVKYVDNKKKVCIICPKHGEFWQSPIKHLIGQTCPKCFGRNITQEEFINKCKSLYGDNYTYDHVSFANLSSIVTVTCKQHGMFKVQAGLLYRGICGCKKCHESNGEKIVSHILDDLHIEYIREYKIINPYHKHNFRVDFYIPSTNSIIEFNGQQHYYSCKKFGGKLQFEKQRTRDLDLRNYCVVNKIRLLEIKYNDKNIKSHIEAFLNVPS